MNHESRALKRIKRNLKNILQAAPVLKEAKGAGRVFELYVMMRVAKALKDAGWMVEPLSSDGNPILTPVAGMHNQKPQAFIMRGGSPTGIMSAKLGNSGPSSIRISRHSASYEILNGVQFQGRSGAAHELDISIVPHQLAVALRATSGGGVPFGRPRVAIECKDVAAAGIPDEMRSVVARMYDITVLKGHLAHLGLQGKDSYIFDCPTNPSVLADPAPNTFMESNRSSLCVLARRGRISQGALAMTQLYEIKTYVKVVQPSVSADVLISDVVTWISNNL